MTDETPRIEVTIGAPVDAVWQAIRQKEKIRHWHGWQFDGLEDEIHLIYFTGQAEDAGARTLDVQGGDLFRLEPVENGTRVTLTRAGPSGDPEWDAYYDDVTEGWITFLQQLRFFLERQPEKARRTLFLSGRTDRTGPLVERLGLGDVAGSPAGTPFEVELLGQQVRGELWFETDHQFGVTVDALGHDGLLIAAYTPPSEKKPEGAAMLVASTYGLDDERYDALERQWTAWWLPRYGA